MKTLSVLLTVALFVTANMLAAHLKHINALPANTAHPANDIGSTSKVAAVRFQVH